MALCPSTIASAYRSTYSQSKLSLIWPPSISICLRWCASIRCFFTRAGSQHEAKPIDANVSYDSVSLDINCSKCTSPKFDELAANTRKPAAIQSLQTEVARIVRITRRCRRRLRRVHRHRHRQRAHDVSTPTSHAVAHAGAHATSKSAAAASTAAAVNIEIWVAIALSASIMKAAPTASSISAR